MPSDIFKLKEADTYAVIGWDVTPYQEKGWPGKVRRVAVPLQTLVFARADILEATKDAPSLSEPRPNMPGPMQLTDGTVVIEGIGAKEEALSVLDTWDNTVGPTEEIVLTRGAVLRMIAERLPADLSAPTAG